LGGGRYAQDYGGCVGIFGHPRERQSGWCRSEAYISR
jgi:hypothetical protein